MGKVRFRIAPRLDELDQRSLASFKFGDRQPAAKEFMP
jgi:hypothetical protein